MDTEPFSHQLRRYRHGQNLSQQALADTIGCSVSLIRKLERGTRMPSRQMVLLLIEVLDLARDAQERFIWSALYAEQHVLDLAAPHYAEQRDLTSTELPPIEWAQVIGRATELATLWSLVRQPDVRLITVTGLGGVGKTCIAQAISESARRVFPRVVVIDLSTVSTQEQLLETVAAACGVALHGSSQARAQLCAALANEHLLLMLDTMEHLLSAATLLADLLQAAPALTILVTSRVRLNLRHEHELPILPLPVPPRDASKNLGELAQVPAVALLLTRVRAIQANTVLTPTTAPLIAGICQRLAGIPLALELIAGWFRVLAPADIYARLDEQLQMLVHGRIDAPARQQTMEATIRWSYDLLSSTAQRLFCCLGVFHGCFSLSAIRTITAQVGLPSAPPVIHDLYWLVTAHLVQQLPVEADETCFMLHGLVREFALRELHSLGLASTVQAATADYFRTTIMQTSPMLDGVPTPAWLQQMDREAPNWRAALAWLQSCGDTTALAELCVALSRYWLTRGQWDEGVRWCQAALQEQAALAYPLSSMLMNAIGTLWIMQGEYATAEPILATALELWQTHDDQLGCLRTANQLGLCAWSQGHLNVARQLLTQAYTVAQRIAPHSRNTANLLSNLGCVADEQGDWAQASAYLAQSLALRVELGDTHGQVIDLVNLGQVTLGAGELAAASEWLTQGQALAEAVGDQMGQAYCVVSLGNIALEHGAYTQARAQIEQGYRLFEQLDDPIGIARAEQMLGMLAHATGSVQQAETYLLQALQRLIAIDTHRGVADLLEHLAAVVTTDARAEEAARLLGMAHALRTRTQIQVCQLDAQRNATTINVLQARLGAHEYQQWFQQGVRVAEHTEVLTALLHTSAQPQKLVG